MNWKTFSNRGFTLVELMVVVAIIGVLSAVAVPNFKTYQAKSKTSEAKLALSSIYSAQTALYTDYDSYAPCLDFAGYDPNPKYYASGFTDSATSGRTTVNDNAGSANPCSANGAGVSRWDATRDIGDNAAKTGDLSNGSISGASFTAAAEGYVSGDSGDSEDHWTVDENKQISHVQIGYN